MERKFYHMGKLVREARLKVGIDQSRLAALLDYKNGQLISNVERGMQSLPVNAWKRLIEELPSISIQDLAKAAQDDMADNLVKMLELKSRAQLLGTKV